MGVGGCQGSVPPRGPISFIFMQFSAKILPNNSDLAQILGLVPVPRLGNPGSTTESYFCWVIDTNTGALMTPQKGRTSVRKKLITRLHSSSMRIACLLPISPSMHCAVGGGGAWSGGDQVPGGSCLWSRCVCVCVS